MKAVAIPRAATTHIQNTEPGPPATTAKATPVMEPVPTLAAIPMAKAWKEEMPSLAPLREFSTTFNMWGKSRICMAWVMMVYPKPTPSSRAERIHTTVEP